MGFYEKLLEKSNDFEKNIFTLSIEKDMVEKKIAEIEKEKDAIDLLSFDLAIESLKNFSSQKRSEAIAKFTNLADMAVKYCFGVDEEFKIHLEMDKKKPKAVVSIVNSKTGVEMDPLDDGGGLVDILSVALRLVALRYSDNPSNGPIILDEPFKMLSAKYQPGAIDFIQSASKDFGRQIIMITHNDTLAAMGKVVRIAKDEEGVSHASYD